MERKNAGARVLVVAGTRPEAIKVAPVVQALAADPDLSPVLVATGQHADLLDDHLELFGLTPAHDLRLHRPGQGSTALTARVLDALGAVMDAERPDAVLVQGDTSTTVAGALAGFHAQAPVVHLEAGLRSGDLTAPFPEEANRRLVSVLAKLHLAPTATALAALSAEGVDREDIVVTGNTVIDALRWAVDRAPPLKLPALADLEGTDRRVLVATAHRRESWGPPLERVAAGLARIAAARPDLVIVFPAHPNPTVLDALAPLRRLENVRVLEPLGYLEFARLLARAHLVVTDSGGIQEEAPSLGVPVLVLRDVTERPEAVQAGGVRLVGTDADRLVAEIDRLLDDPAAHAAMARNRNPYGDGHAASRAVQALRWLLRGGQRPEEFRVR